MLIAIIILTTIVKIIMNDTINNKHKIYMINIKLKILKFNMIIKKFNISVN